MAWTEADAEALADKIAKAQYESYRKDVYNDPYYKTKNSQGFTTLTATAESQLAQARKHLNGIKASIKVLLMKDPNYANLNDEDILQEVEHPTGRSPDQIATDKAEAKRKQEFKPLVAFNEDSEQPWYKMTPNELAREAYKLGYDILYNENDRKDFFDKLRQDSRDVDVNRIVDEYLSSPSGILGSIVIPTAVDEGVKQATTGEYNDDKLDHAISLDVGTNMLMGMAPVVSNVGRFGNYVLEPAIQTVLEMGRQGTQKGLKLGDETFNWGDVGGTLVAGTVTPMSKGLVAEMAGRLGPEGRVFSQGVQSTSSLDPLEIERRTNLSDIARANGKESGITLKAGLGKNARNAEKKAVQDKEQAFYDLSYDQGGGNIDKNFFTPSKRIERAQKNVNDLYDQPWKYDLEEDVDDLIIDDMRKEGQPVILSGADVLKNIETQSTQKDLDKVEPFVPQLIASMKTLKDPLYRTGKFVGNALGDFGDAIEPAYRFNPSTALSGLLHSGETNLSSQRNTHMNKDDYKETDWYKKLDKKGKDRVDKAMSEKSTLLTEND